ncbi:MAG: hypothetical protein ACYC6F_18840 [Longimicrobiales bacterium]
MSVCIVAEYPWRNIRNMPGLELPGVVVCSDTRVLHGRQVTPWLASKQKPVAKNIFVCYTSSNLFATLTAVDASLGTRSVSRIGKALRQAHENYGGASEMLAVVWTRKLPPQVLELMPPSYAPTVRRGVVGIGDRAVLVWVRDNFPEDDQTEEQQAFLERLRTRVSESIVFPEPHYPIEQASMQVVAALTEGIRVAGGPSVSLPVQAAVVNNGSARALDVMMSPDARTFEEVTIRDRDATLPSLRPIRVAEDRIRRTALQIIPGS